MAPHSEKDHTRVCSSGVRQLQEESLEVAQADGEARSDLVPGLRVATDLPTEEPICVPDPDTPFQNRIAQDKLHGLVPLSIAHAAPGPGDGLEHTFHIVPRVHLLTAFRVGLHAR